MLKLLKSKVFWYSVAYIAFGVLVFLQNALEANRGTGAI